MMTDNENLIQDHDEAHVYLSDIFPDRPIEVNEFCVQYRECEGEFWPGLMDGDGEQIAAAFNEWLKENEPDPEPSH